MAARFWNIEWTDQNSQRSYPLTEWSTKTDTSGVFKLPDDLILGLYFPVASNIEVLPDRFFIRQIVVYGSGMSIAIGYDDDSGNPPVIAVAQIALASHDEYDVYALPGKNDFIDSVGRIMIGKLDVIQQLPVGKYIFEPQATSLEADAIQPMISGVTALVVDGVRLQDDIVLEAGENIRFDVTQGEDGRWHVRIDAIDGSGLSEAPACGDRTGAKPIYRINGIGATPTGDWTLGGNQCLDVVPQIHGVQLVDKCSEPCCDCRDLKSLTDELELFGAAATTVQGFVNRLQSEVTQMNQTVLGSLLGDRGCQECNLEI
jgi:hypothetical protein